jgi:hypothetical protein
MRALADKSSLLKKDRMRMVDWMIEVLSNFAAQGCGTNEHTYFFFGKATGYHHGFVFPEKSRIVHLKEFAHRWGAGNVLGQ